MREPMGKLILFIFCPTCMAGVVDNAWRELKMHQLSRIARISITMPLLIT